ncbi:MAG: TolC family protein [Acidobacteria bacterium]|nr:TolC family protein [Acidobacteriota bacterium]
MLGLHLGLISLFALGQPEPAPAANGQTAGSVLRLGLRQAVDIAIEQDGNAKVRLAAQLLQQAKAQSAQERSALLPNLDASVVQQNRTTNLEAVGIQFDIALPGFETPRFVGPFDTFDARVKASQSLLDLSAIRRFQASKAGVGEAQSQSESAKNEVAGLVAGHYLSALRAEAGWQAAGANVELAKALLDLAADQKKAGAGTGIEVIRAEVQLANERQHLLLAENERHKAHLQLLRVMGLKLDVPLELSQELSAARFPAGPLADLIATALTSRAEFQAQSKREEKLRLQYSAVKWERLPSIHGFADYGSLGSSLSNSLPTRSLGVSLNLPLFDGGRRDARRAEIQSRWEQERIRTEDLRAQIELEIRIALDNLRSTEEQVKVAEEGLQLAGGELAQAQRRYRSGVTTNVEVTDAQTRMERARENRISSLFQFNRAKIDLGQAMGTIRSLIESGQLGN